MTNEEAINHIRYSLIEGNYPLPKEVATEVLNLAIKALRQMNSCPVFSDNEVRQPCVETPCNHERPQGEWLGNRIISCGTILKRGDNVLEQQCTKCKRFNIKWVDSIPNKFCPNCGADMREADNEQ